MHRYMNHEEGHFFAAARLFWPEGCLRDFLAFRRPLAFFKPKKSLKPPSGKNNLAAAKRLVLPNDSYIGAFLLKIYQCFVDVAAFYKVF